MEGVSREGPTGNSVCKRPEGGGPLGSQRLEGKVPGKAAEGNGEPWKVTRQGWAGPDLFGKPPSGCQEEMEGRG